MDAAELRALAGHLIAQARQSTDTVRAGQLRDSAASLLSQARQRELFEHGKTVGRRNVTSASYRQYLRTRVGTGGAP